ncbi:hypothetical protein ACSSS7_004367 [Eimeria intestinalis]
MAQYVTMQLQRGTQPGPRFQSTPSFVDRIAEHLSSTRNAPTVDSLIQEGAEVCEEADAPHWKGALTPQPGSSCHAGAPEPLSNFAAVSAGEGSREAEPPTTSAGGAQSCEGDLPAAQGRLNTAANIGHSKASRVDSDGSHNVRAEKEGGCRNSSLVRMKLSPDTALPPALNGNNGAADILKEVWHCPKTPAPLATETQSVNKHDISKGGSDLAEPSVSPTKLADLIHELVGIGFASVQEQKLLRTSPLAAWARILPSVSARYCQRRYALDLNKHKRADFMLCRHQNGLLMVGLAPTHYILEEARRRRKWWREGPGTVPAGTYSVATSGPESQPKSALAPATDKNPLLQEDEGGACMNALTLGTELHSSPSSQRKDNTRTSGPLLKVAFKQEPCECTATGKRKRGGAQLHVRMRLGTISLQEPFSTAVNRPPERSASDSGVAGATEGLTSEAPIFGCITGELLEVNEALANDADVLLRPGWGIFVDEQEAFALRPHLLNFQEKL